MGTSTLTEGDRPATSTTAPSTWYAVQGGNDLTWRVTSPARLLGGKVNLIDEQGGYYALTQPNDDSDFKWGLELTYVGGLKEEIWSDEKWTQVCEARRQVTDCRQVYRDHEGVAVWTRPDICRATHAKAMREQHGFRTVAELDDNYLTDPKFNYFMTANKWSKSDRLDHMKAIASMDAIIVSTEYLRDEYWKELRKQFGKSLKPEIHVCANHIDEEYVVEPIQSDRLRVGYMGSDSHLWDIELARPALTWAYEQGCEIVLIGFNPKWRDIEYTHIPWQLPETYRRQALPLDIGLAPIVMNRHTLGKSDIKAMEYLLSGAAPLLQNNLVYNRTFVAGETALFAGGPSEFLEQTKQLVNSRHLREHIVNQGQQYIQRERMLLDHKHEWETAVFG